MPVDDPKGPESYHEGPATKVQFGESYIIMMITSNASVRPIMESRRRSCEREDFKVTWEMHMNPVTLAPDPDLLPKLKLNMSAKGHSRIRRGY